MRNEENLNPKVAYIRKRRPIPRTARAVELCLTVASLQNLYRAFGLRESQIAKP